MNNNAVNLYKLDFIKNAGNSSSCSSNPQNSQILLLLIIKVLNNTLVCGAFTFKMSF